jgi:YHS domain-containing protein
VKDPEQYLKALKIDVRSALHPRQAAVVDSSERVFVGHDLFYFANAAERQKFIANPLGYCRQLTDPVTLARFKPSRQSPHTTFRGRPYYFASDSTFESFNAAPDSFAVRKGM